MRVLLPSVDREAYFNSMSQNAVSDFPWAMCMWMRAPAYFLFRLRETEKVHLGVIKFNVIFPVDLVTSGLEFCVSNNIPRYVSLLMTEQSYCTAVSAL